jgi:hypothetical protein
LPCFGLDWAQESDELRLACVVVALVGVDLLECGKLAVRRLDRLREQIDRAAR